MEFNVDPSQAFISGDVTTYFEAKENMNQIIFDLADNMIVSQVLQRGSPLSFSQNTNDELVINLDIVFGGLQKVNLGTYMLPTILARLL